MLCIAGLLSVTSARIAVLIILTFFSLQAAAQVALPLQPQHIIPTVLKFESDCDPEAIVPEAFSFRQLTANSIEFTVTAPLSDSMGLNDPKTLTWDPERGTYGRKTEEKLLFNNVILGRSYELSRFNDGSWMMDYRGTLSYKGLIGKLSSKILKTHDCSALISLGLDLVEEPAAVPSDGHADSRRSLFDQQI